MFRFAPILAFLAFLALACGGTETDPATDETAPTGPTAAAWDGLGTFVCRGVDEKTITGVKYDIPGKDTLAIDAGGSCQLEIVDSDITADFPLKATGNAHVHIKGGRMVGRRQAIQAWSNAVVDVEGTTVVGDAVTTGAGKINGVPSVH
jgi:hypothetical protein